MSGAILSWELGWDLSALVFKLLFYLAVCASIGGLATIALERHNPLLARLNARYAIFGSGGGLIVIWLQFIQQIGAFNEDGLGGIFDSEIALMLLESNVGSGTYLRTLAMFLLLIAGVCAYYRPVAITIWAGPGVIGAGLLAFSFSVIGHVAELTPLAIVAITLHIVAISWWLGSLVPLLISAKLLDILATQQLMHRFGRVAVAMIAALIVSGGYLIVQLVGSVERALTTAYGQALLLKLLIVVIMLGLGALNKLRLVPDLTRINGSQKLARAIKLEMLLGITILSITAIFTTLTGPGY